MQIRKSKQPKIQQNKTTLVQLPVTTLGQETRWAYSTTLPSTHGAPPAAGGLRSGGSRRSHLVNTHSVQHTGTNIQGGPKNGAIDS